MAKILKCLWFSCFLVVALWHVTSGKPAVLPSSAGRTHLLPSTPSFPYYYHTYASRYSGQSSSTLSTYPLSLFITNHSLCSHSTATVPACSGMLSHKLTFLCRMLL